MNKVINRSILIDMVFYLFICSGGYWSTFNYTNTVVLIREPLASQDINYPTLIAAVVVCLVLIVSIPANFFPFRK